MRICHLSDTHLGAGENHPKRGPSGLTLRQEDIIRSFIEAVDRIIEIKPDVCIHSGDLFNRVRPLNRIMAIAGQELHRLAEVNRIPTIIITGNHDAPKQPHIGAAIQVFGHIENLHIASAGKLEQFEIMKTRFFALPHCLTTGILKEQLAQCFPDQNAAFNVLIMHGVAAGMPQFSMADLGEQELPLDVMDRFDYTALGHFHNSCCVNPRAHYAGSTERLSQAERDVAKGFLAVSLDTFGVSFREVTSRKMIDLQVIDAAGKRGDQLAPAISEQLENVDSSDKIVRVNVQGVTAETLKTIPSNVLAELREKSFDLDVRLERDKGEDSGLQFGRSAIGRLDQGFLQYLEGIDLEGFDRERLKREALKYLSAED